MNLRDTLHAGPNSNRRPHPDWWNARGWDMRVQTDDPEAGLIVLQNKTKYGSLVPTAFLRISRNEDGTYTLAWVLALQDDTICGSMVMDGEDLLHAFDSHDDVDLRSSNYAHPGFYARSGSFLSIPNRGTGRDGDRNLSVFINPAIWLAVVPPLKQALRTKAN